MDLNGTGPIVDRRSIRIAAAGAGAGPAALTYVKCLDFATEPSRRVESAGPLPCARSAPSHSLSVDPGLASVAPTPRARPVLARLRTRRRLQPRWPVAPAPPAPAAPPAFALGTKTPWNLIRCRRARGTSAASRCMNSSGLFARCVVPSRQGVLMSLASAFIADPRDLVHRGRTVAGGSHAGKDVGV